MKLLQTLLYFTRKHWTTVLRAFMAFGALSLLAPATARVEWGPPHQVETLRDQVCVHTRLIDEVEEWKIQRTLAMVREMGARTIVEFFPWAYIEGQRDRYDWSQADRIIAHAGHQGLTVIARLGLVPQWARETPDSRAEESLTTLNTLPEAAYPDFAEFAAAFAERYAGTVDHLIIWNEPNLAFEWGYRQVSAADYARLLQAVYAPIHEANPDAIVLAAPLAPTLEPEGSPNGLNDVLYLEQFYEAGAAAFFDALAVHTYGFTHPAEAPPAFDALNFRRVELLRDLMVRFGDEQTPVYVTETGWNDHPRWALAVSPAERIRYTLDALSLADANWDWASSICLWVFRFPAPTYSHPDHFALITPDFVPHPIYHAVQGYARGWGDSP